MYSVQRTKFPAKISGPRLPLGFFEHFMHHLLATPICATHPFSSPFFPLAVCHDPIGHDHTALQVACHSCNWPLLLVGRLASTPPSRKVPCLGPSFWRSALPWSLFLAGHLALAPLVPNSLFWITLTFPSLKLSTPTGTWSVINLELLDPYAH